MKAYEFNAIKKINTRNLKSLTTGGSREKSKTLTWHGHQAS